MFDTIYTLATFPAFANLDIPNILVILDSLPGLPTHATPANIPVLATHSILDSINTIITFTVTTVKYLGRICKKFCSTMFCKKYPYLKTFSFGYNLEATQEIILYGTLFTFSIDLSSHIFLLFSQLTKLSHPQTARMLTRLKPRAAEIEKKIVFNYNIRAMSC